MTPAAMIGHARDAARLALGREPTDAEIAHVLAAWCSQLDSAVSDGYMRRSPRKPVRAPKNPPPVIDAPVK